MIRDIIKNSMSVSLLAGLLMMNGVANAAPVLDFVLDAPAAGSITFDTNTPGDGLIGDGIEIQNIIGSSTPTNSGSPGIVCIDCFLDFTTGAGSTTDGGVTWDFASGGSISIIGSLDTDPGTAGNEVSNETLLTGSFDSASLTTVNDGLFLLEVGNNGTFTDEKHLGLLDYFGLSDYQNETFSGSLAINFSALTPDINAGTLESLEIHDGHVYNTAPPIPIPAAALLFVPAFLGIAAFSSFRRKKSKSNNGNSSCYPANGMLLPA